jgi:thymidylate kinase
VELRKLRFWPGSLVVLEGLDRSGKSTQRHWLSTLDWAAPAPLFTHMPSGLARVTESIYTLTEDVDIKSPLARQLLHLACHAENIAAIAEARHERGVVLDRWWWSTVAYGWYGCDLANLGVDERAFFGMINSIWARQPADLVFLFTSPFEGDELNRDQVRRGYEVLARQHASTTVEVPAADEATTTAFLVEQLVLHKLVKM